MTVKKYLAIYTPDPIVEHWQLIVEHEDEEEAKDIVKEVCEQHGWNASHISWYVSHTSH